MNLSTAVDVFAPIAAVLNLSEISFTRNVDKHEETERQVNTFLAGNIDSFANAFRQAVNIYLDSLPGTAACNGCATLSFHTPPCILIPQVSKERPTICPYNPERKLTFWHLSRDVDSDLLQA